jgi:ABC-type polar amino acid transport system ATPase subunit
MRSGRGAQAGSGVGAAMLAEREIFMDFGEVVEEHDPYVFFDTPQHERTKRFLSQFL